MLSRSTRFIRGGKTGGSALFVAFLTTVSILAGEGAIEAVVNLLANPGAETLISDEQFAKAVNVNYMVNNEYLEIADNVPENWGVYCNGEVKVKWGSTDKEFHTGKSSCFMTLVDPLKAGENHFDCLLFSQSNGANGEKGIPVEAGVTYKYSFWIKGEAEKSTIRLFTWKTDTADKDMKWEGLDYGLAINKDWTQVTGTITPKEGVKKFILGVSIGNAKAGQSIYVDDVEVSVNKK